MISPSTYTGKLYMAQGSNLPTIFLPDSISFPSSALRQVGTAGTYVGTFETHELL